MFGRQYADIADVRTRQHAPSPGIRSPRSAHAPHEALRQLQRRVGNGTASQLVARHAAPLTVQRVYIIKHPDSGIDIDLDHPMWTADLLMKLSAKIKEPAHLEKIRQRVAELLGGTASAPPTGTSTSDWALRDLLSFGERASKAADYTKNPLEIKHLALGEETERLIEDSPELSAHKLASVKGGAMTTGAGMALNQVVKYGAEVLGESLGPIASGASTVMNVGITSSQSARLGMLTPTNAAVRGDIGQLTSERAKKAVTQAGSGALSVGTGVAVGGAIGTAIPVPVLGTLVGILLGAGAGFTVSKITEWFGDKALQSPPDLWTAAQRLHLAALANDADALAAFKIFGIDAATAKAPDGWKALASAVAAKPDLSDDL
jgi:hypothetical protein